MLKKKGSSFDASGLYSNASLKTFAVPSPNSSLFTHANPPGPLPSCGILTTPSPRSPSGF